MVSVTRLDNTHLVINSDLIEYIESIPETIICLTTGKKIMVKEKVEEIVERVTLFRRSINESIMIKQYQEGDREDA